MLDYILVFGIYLYDRPLLHQNALGLGGLKIAVSKYCAKSQRDRQTTYASDFIYEINSAQGIMETRNREEYASAILSITKINHHVRSSFTSLFLSLQPGINIFQAVLSTYFFFYDIH